MLKRKTSLRLGATVATGALVGAVLVGGGAGAAPGDVVDNPGPFTLTLEGNFFNLAGNAIDIPSSADAVQCDDNINNDTAVQVGALPQDTNIDYDGGGVGAADAQCNSGGTGMPASTDDSEAKAGYQAKTPITLSGSIDSDGNVTIPQASVVFPTFYVYGNPGGVIDIVISATGNGSGSLDPATGLTTLNVPIGIRVVQAFFNIDCTISPISLGLTTDGAAPENGGVLPVAPVAYSQVNGQVTVSNNTFAVPAAVVTPGGNAKTTQAICDTISSSFGNLPADPGESAAEFLAISNTIFVPGAPAGPSIAGHVTNDSAGDVPGVFVTLMNPSPSWSIIDTVMTDSSGNYSFTGIADGDYVVRFFDPTGTYQRTWYSGNNTYSTADTITVAGGPVTADQQLQDRLAGSIGGRAFDQSSNAPVAGVQVSVFSTTDGFVQTVFTGADGYWRLLGLPDGDYTVRFYDASKTYHKQWYLQKTFGWNADTVTVSGGPASASAPLVLV